ncbi:hypothetical protein JOF53_000355 [Crossiella equi]|uniref:Uncharacterized protein n=1 Tax=Crossiella equi TaxID=130796 RepID=A0ABS5A4I1_9PSEU|nr:hypothetical protein [Crossiella equi]MBP2471483.1 hypothetical protein [Crossiella equi]
MHRTAPHVRPAATNAYSTCLRRGENPRKCQEQRDACRANVEKKYRDRLFTCTRRAA